MIVYTRRTGERAGPVLRLGPVQVRELKGQGLRNLSSKARSIQSVTTEAHLFRVKGVVGAGSPDLGAVNILSELGLGWRTGEEWAKAHSTTCCIKSATKLCCLAAVKRSRVDWSSIDILGLLLVRLDLGWVAAHVVCSMCLWCGRGIDPLELPT
jgi:hypothetical protein